MPLETHRFASMLPAPDDSVFCELVEDIRVNGLLEPITLFEGKILDGVNRYHACLETGIEPLLKVYEGTDPLGFVISMNLQRRHLNETQRAMVAAKIATMRQGARTDLSPIDERSQENAATLLNVSKRSVERAAKVLNRGALELVEKVERGEVSVSAAAAVADLSEAEQRAVVNQGRKVVAQAAKAARLHRMLACGPIEPRHERAWRAADPAARSTPKEARRGSSG